MKHHASALEETKPRYIYLFDTVSIRNEPSPSDLCHDVRETANSSVIENRQERPPVGP
jgi:hypothetical protein